MRQMKWILVSILWLAGVGASPAQTDERGELTASQPGAVLPHQHAEKEEAALDAQRKKRALQIFLKSIEKEIVSAADAMPADKYGFAPTDGEFKGVRTFGQQVKHLAATNHILAAAALGEDPPTDSGDELGPEALRTKAEILDYLRGSFAHLGKAINAIGDKNVTVRSSPISPLSATGVTRMALIVEALMHSLNHYGQMVEYLRMNGVVPRLAVHEAGVWNAYVLAYGF
jgi:uncharacterized damage-inducible protein DinB